MAPLLASVLAALGAGAAAAQEEIEPVFTCEPLAGDLVRNGGAEQGASAPSRERTVTVPGWRTTGGLTVLRYGQDAELPGPSSPGPVGRGRQFFVGGRGAAGEATAEQIVSLARYQRSIDRRRAGVLMRACLGGSRDRLDAATVTAEFLDGAGDIFGIGQIGPVSAWQRRNATGLRPQVLTGAIPEGTAAVRITIRMPRATAGVAFGVVDNVSLVVTERP
jgi:hypothetical protein